MERRKISLLPIGVIIVCILTAISAVIYVQDNSSLISIVLFAIACITIFVIAVTQAKKD